MTRMNPLMQSILDNFLAQGGKVERVKQGKRTMKGHEMRRAIRGELTTEEREAILARRAGE